MQHEFLDLRYVHVQCVCACMHVLRLRISTVRNVQQEKSFWNSIPHASSVYTVLRANNTDYSKRGIWPHSWKKSDPKAVCALQIFTTGTWGDIALFPGLGTRLEKTVPSHRKTMEYTLVCTEMLNLPSHQKNTRWGYTLDNEHRHIHLIP